jgi:hypothetical protein
MPNDKVQAATGLDKISEQTRVQTIIFHVASTIYNAEKRTDWKCHKDVFLAQLVRLVGELRILINLNTNSGRT